MSTTRNSLNMTRSLSEIIKLREAEEKHCEHSEQESGEVVRVLKRGRTVSTCEERHVWFTHRRELAQTETPEVTWSKTPESPPETSKFDILPWTPTIRPRRMVRVSQRTVEQTSWTVKLPIVSCSMSVSSIVYYLEKVISSRDLIDVNIRYIVDQNRIQYVVRVSSVSAMEDVEKYFGVTRSP